MHQGLQRNERSSRGRELLRAVLGRCQGLKRDYYSEEEISCKEIKDCKDIRSAPRQSSAVLVKRSRELPFVRSGRDLQRDQGSIIFGSSRLSQQIGKSPSGLVRILWD